MTVYDIIKDYLANIKRDGKPMADKILMDMCGRITLAKALISDTDQNGNPITVNNDDLDPKNIEDLSKFFAEL